MTTKEFIEKVGLNTDMQAAISQCTSPKEAYDYAKKEGLTDGMEQFLEIMQKVREASNEMTAADVDSVTGGADTSAVVSVVVSASAVNVSISVTTTAAAACGL